MDTLRWNYRTYGNAPFNVIVLHGGPGAPGEMETVARELSTIAGVMEPLQTSDSIEKQLRELHDIAYVHGNLPFVLVGWSWGAMLGYIFTSHFPDLVRKLILVSSGVFDEKYTAPIMETRLERLNERERKQAFSLRQKLEEPPSGNMDILLEQFGILMFKADVYNPLSTEIKILSCNYDTYRRVWQEASELRRSGKLLTMGRSITCPVVALHGDYDSHPGGGIRGPLSKIIKDFRFILMEKCGHYPWLEIEARDEFYRILKAEITL